MTNFKFSFLFILLIDLSGVFLNSVFSIEMLQIVWCLSKKIKLQLCDVCLRKRVRERRRRQWRRWAFNWISLNWIQVQVLPAIVKWSKCVYPRIERPLLPLSTVRCGGREDRGLHYRRTRFDALHRQPFTVSSVCCCSCCCQWRWWWWTPFNWPSHLFGQPQIRVRGRATAKGLILWQWFSLQCPMWPTGSHSTVLIDTL